MQLRIEKLSARATAREAKRKGLEANRKALIRTERLGIDRKDSELIGKARN